MTTICYRFSVAAEDQNVAGRSANALADTLREADGVLETSREKTGDANNGPRYCCVGACLLRGNACDRSGARRVVAGTTGDNGYR